MGSPMNNPPYTDPGNPNSPELDVWASLGLSVDKLTTQVQQANERRRRRPDNVVTRYQLRFPLTIPATSTITCLPANTLGPSEGYRWHIRRFSLVDNASPVTPAYTTIAASLHKGHLVQIPNGAGGVVQAYDQGSVIWNFTAVPSHQTWTGTAQVVLPPEQLYITAANTAGTAANCTAVVEVENMPEWLFQAEETIDV